MYDRVKVIFPVNMCLEYHYYYLVLSTLCFYNGIISYEMHSICSPLPPPPLPPLPTLYPSLYHGMKYLIAMTFGVYLKNCLKNSLDVLVHRFLDTDISIINLPFFFWTFICIENNYSEQFDSLFLKFDILIISTFDQNVFFYIVCTFCKMDCSSWLMFM